ncbi:MAG: hypothetical protein ABSA42_03855 [Terracidiphilus sp.]|jgi:hypothetical protein
MNVHEGAKRMTGAGKRLVLTLLTAAILLLTVGAVAAFFVQGKEHLVVLFPIVAMLLVPCIFRIAGWTVEGLAKESD